MELHPIFNDCVARYESRYSMMTPWVAGGYRYATDGRICVRQKTNDPNTPTKSGEKRPDPATLDWRREKFSDIAAVLPAIPDHPLWGYSECDACEGGWYTKRAAMEVGTMLLDNHFIRILIRHGAVCYVSRDSKMCYFQVRDDIDGIVMGIYRDHFPANEIYTVERYIEELKTQRKP